MRSSHESKTFEELAVERDRELERAAAQGASLPPIAHEPAPPRSGTMAAREAAALPWGYSAVAEEYAPLVERLLGRVWHTLYALGEQRNEIVRLRDSTRQVLARLGAT